MTESYLHYFDDIGFYEEKASALNLLKKVTKTLFDNGVDYCIMFGTLLGKLRNNDIIPWDDDIDIIIFDVEKFESRCIKKLKNFSCTTQTDRRLIEDIKSSSSGEKWMRCGYRLYPDDGIPVPGQNWKFPWIGVWEPSHKGSSFVLPPEDHIYQLADFFPLRTVQFQGFPVSIPNSSNRILTNYFKSDNWMEFCVPPDLNHREYKKTHAPLCQILVTEVLDYLKDKNKQKISILLT